MDKRREKVIQKSLAFPSFFVADITVKSEDETPTDDLFCKQ